MKENTVFTCMICACEFSSKQLVTHHIKQTHPEEGEVTDYMICSSTQVIIDNFNKNVYLNTSDWSKSDRPDHQVQQKTKQCEPKKSDNFMDKLMKSLDEPSKMEKLKLYPHKPKMSQLNKKERGDSGTSPHIPPFTSVGVVGPQSQSSTKMTYQQFCDKARKSNAPPCAPIGTKFSKQHKKNSDLQQAPSHPTGQRNPISNQSKVKFFNPVKTVTKPIPPPVPTSPLPDIPYTSMYGTHPTLDLSSQSPARKKTTITTPVNSPYKESPPVLTPPPPETPAPIVTPPPVSLTSNPEHQYADRSNSTAQVRPGKKCGDSNCEPCSASDCGECSHCMNRSLRQKCVLRMCPNLNKKVRRKNQASQHDLRAFKSHLSKSACTLPITPDIPRRPCPDATDSQSTASEGEGGDGNESAMSNSGMWTEDVTAGVRNDIMSQRNIVIDGSMYVLTKHSSTITTTLSPTNNPRHSPDTAPSRIPNVNPSQSQAPENPINQDESKREKRLYRYSCFNCNRKFKYHKRSIQCCEKVSRKFFFKCSICETVITCKQNVSRHKQRCSNIMKLREMPEKVATVHSCEICDSTFAHKISLTRHKVNVHKIEKEKGDFVCGECTYSCNSNLVLKKHKTKCHSTKQFTCESCDCSFFSKSGLKKHKAIHKERCFACIHCTKYFSTKEHLIKHTEKRHQEQFSESESEIDTESDDSEVSSVGLKQKVKGKQPSISSFEGGSQGMVREGGGIKSNKQVIVSCGYNVAGGSKHV